ncbi:MAG: hypothetical protein OEY01_13445 [Desulfobulbaceae bacterium]|nr:hypothetical protein [Desulfobulbaceae bacterium]HIJ79734.1 hypothetical protein [Deltaproteobacteria bacterium]
MAAIIKPILPICSFCRKTRDKGGCWWPSDSNGSSQQAVMLSHTVCPECMAREYPELLEEPWPAQQVTACKKI